MSDDMRDLDDRIRAHYSSRSLDPAALDRLRDVALRESDRTLTAVADVLHTRGLLRAPIARQELVASVDSVLHWWLVKHHKELEP